MQISSIIFFSLLGISLLISANAHGKPKEGNNNFFINLLNTVLTIAIVGWMMNWNF